MNRLETTVLASQANVTVTQLALTAKWVGRGKNARPILTKQTVDFFGAVRAPGTPMHGRMILFDAKECNDPRRFSVKASMRNREHQRIEIVRYGERCNAVAGLLVEATALQAYYWVAWPVLLVPGLVSVPWYRLCALGSSKRNIDFLPAIAMEPHREWARIDLWREPAVAV